MKHPDEYTRLLIEKVKQLLADQVFLTRFCFVKYMRFSFLIDSFTRTSINCNATKIQTRNFTPCRSFK